MPSRLLNYLLSLPRSLKRLIAVSVDLCFLLSSVALSYWVRLDEWIRPSGNQWLPYVAAVVIAVPIFAKMGLYRAIFRHAGFQMLLTIVNAVVLYALLFSTIFALVGIDSVPRTVGIIQPLLLLLALVMSRVSLRMLINWRSVRVARSGQRRPVLVYGAGIAGRQLATAAQTSSDLDVVAFVDDDRTLHGGIINGLDIFPFSHLSTIVKAHSIEEIFLAQPELGRSDRQRLTQQILAEVSGQHVTIRTLPTLLDIAHGKVSVSDLREIEIDDLLGRDPVPPNELLLARTIRSKTVMVTGAGGSIGRELCAQIVSQRPARLVLLDASEYNLYSIHNTLTSLTATEEGVSLELFAVLGSVQDSDQLSRVIETHRPDTIYHAAAYKHVPLVETNIAQGIRNNVLGTLNTARAALAAGVQNFVLISTDKAVRPTNAMGASKRLAEQVLQALAAQGGKTCFSMVRFGNVLGSSGSVVPLFREQIRRGGPVTLTHADVTRYFMTIPEAAQLVIQAGAMARGGEVFVLDMGEPVRIAELARMMIELSGLTVRNADNPFGDIEIREIGMRPGEKLYEELLIGNDPAPTKHPRILQATEPFMPWDQLEVELAKLFAATATVSEAEQVAMLRALVPEYEAAAATPIPASEGMAS